MDVYKVKCRTEFFGVVSGDVYCFIEGSQKYYYLVNILKSNDIRIVRQPKKEKILQKVNEEDLDESLKAFHTEQLCLEEERRNKSSESYKEEQARLQEQMRLQEQARREAEQRRHEKISPYFVSDWDTTEYLIAQIGMTYSSSNVKEVYSNLGKKIYIIAREEGDMKLVIRDPYGLKEYSLTKVEDERAQYKAKMERVIAKTEVPWHIAKIFINMLPEEKTIELLKIIKADKSAGMYQEHLDCLWYYAENYVYDLSGKISNWHIRCISNEKKEAIYRYVSQK